MSLFLFLFQLTAEEQARTEVEARLSATNELYKEATTTYEADRTQKEQEMQKLQEEVIGLICSWTCTYLLKPLMVLVHEFVVQFIPVRTSSLFQLLIYYDILMLYDT